MSDQNYSNSVVGLFASHEGAEFAVKKLHKSGYDMKKLSVIGKDYQTEENVVGYYNIGERMASWGNSDYFGDPFGDSCLARPFLSS